MSIDQVNTRGEKGDCTMYIFYSFPYENVMGEAFLPLRILQLSGYLSWHHKFLGFSTCDELSAKSVECREHLHSKANDPTISSSFLTSLPPSNYFAKLMNGIDPHSHSTVIHLEHPLYLFNKYRNTKLIKNITFKKEITWPKVLSLLLTSGWVMSDLLSKKQGGERWLGGGVEI